MLLFQINLLNMSWNLGFGLQFSSLFPCDSEYVNKKFRDAAVMLNLLNKKPLTINEIYRNLNSEVVKHTMKIGDNYSSILDVPTTGGWQLYVLQSCWSTYRIDSA